MVEGGQKRTKNSNPGLHAALDAQKDSDNCSAEGTETASLLL